MPQILSVLQYKHAQIQKVYLFVFLVDERREDPNTTISGPSSARWWAGDGPTLNAGLVAL